MNETPNPYQSTYERFRSYGLLEEDCRMLALEAEEEWAKTETIRTIVREELARA